MGLFGQSPAPRRKPQRERARPRTRQTSPQGPSAWWSPQGADDLAAMLGQRREKCHGLHDRGAPSDPGDGARLRHEGGAAGRQQARSGEGRHPAGADPEAGRHGLFRHRHPRAVRRPGAGRVRVLPDHRGAGARLDERRLHHRPRQRPVGRPRHDRRTTRRFPAAGRARRIFGRRGHVGTKCRLGPGRHLLPRAARRRRLGDQRQQVLVHLRRRRRLHHAGGAHLRSARSQAQACRPVVVPDREAARHAAAGRARARRFPRSATSAGRPGSSPSTIAACRARP